MSKTFYLVDVFTEIPFRGNQLAVFPDADGLDSDTMQSIAAELNFSETVFVFPADPPSLRRLRIFTPRQELPLAGHPVVGCWAVLASTGVLPTTADGTITIYQELPAGVLPVEITLVGGNATSVTMTQAPLVLGPVIGNPAFAVRIAEALGIDASDIAASDELPIRTSSTGIVSLDVPVGGLEVLGRISVDPRALTALYREAGAIGCHVFALETFEPTSRVHARFFAPDDNIPEDAATGSASGSLAGYLVHHGALDAGEFTIEQGDFMGRSSRIVCTVAGGEGAVAEVKVGGCATIVAKGEFFVTGV
jgi:trans-2,3-dihydro-3-hydroxyanthranilate isomerase